MSSTKIQVGIGFITGRKTFSDVVGAYINAWKSNSSGEECPIEVNLFVVTDFQYTDTTEEDYIIRDKNVLNSINKIYYLDKEVIDREVKYLLKDVLDSEEEAALIFGDGYAKMRNQILYFAKKENMDYLIFFDDDEYPLACLKEGEHLLWAGQDPISTHVKHLQSSDMTNGFHCGYISPIPKIEYNDVFREEDFKNLIESVSNDILSWDSVKEVLEQDGITYAQREKLNIYSEKEVMEANGMKFISGGNLGFNLDSIHTLFPFYNPPGARGEDTFLSTCLQDITLFKIPLYTFHDGFLFYPNILKGALPIEFPHAIKSSNQMISRFRKALIGWIRYKPLFLFITQRDSYDEEISKIYSSLESILPKLCKYFDDDRFYTMLSELNYYNEHVEEHFEDFNNTKNVWQKLMHYLDS
ncbi:hypothetical protein SAMN02745245_01119 [Anaerosphaera aminiphila DSM 21120]|uniref:Uncharacterized protein n=1 Tax=Anaerosphaera aminiphila DSM 21120 TaxID=1120995 RepID=A0A1M5S542_9FIRM|nr:hypothetical protein [Anaerosphaera aminiphila]SHH33614.1 hypothetical protein SAMN02745245_01119 [Anaerosphaera aminiphila DSM 21120]